jgi:hypothetical protein
MRFDNQLIERIARKSVLPRDMGDQFEKHGFTHIVISMDLFNQWSAPNFTTDQVALVQSFFRDEAQLLFHKDSHALYQIGK